MPGTDIRNLLTQHSIHSTIYEIMWRLSWSTYRRVVEWLCICTRPRRRIRRRNSNVRLWTFITGRDRDFFEEHFQGRWDLPLLELTQRSTDTMIISSKRRGRGSRRVGRKITLICKNGGSKFPWRWIRPILLPVSWRSENNSPCFGRLGIYHRLWISILILLYWIFWRILPGIRRITLRTYRFVCVCVCVCVCLLLF